jgi:hypothetical protein
MGAKVVYLADLLSSEDGSSKLLPPTAAGRRAHRVKTATAIRHCLTSLMEEAKAAELNASVLGLQLAIDAISGDLVK